MENIIIKKARSKKEVDDALGVRHQVFVMEQKINKDIEHDLYDETSNHFIAYLSNKPIGAGRIRKLSPKTAKIERMAILSNYRGKNIGGELLKSMLEFLKDKNVQEVVLNSQFQAKGFYERYGFMIEGDIFQEANIDHIKMKKNLK